MQFVYPRLKHIIPEGVHTVLFYIFIDNMALNYITSNHPPFYFPECAQNAYPANNTPAAKQNSEPPVLKFLRIELDDL